MKRVRYSLKLRLLAAVRRTSRIFAASPQFEPWTRSVLIHRACLRENVDQCPAGFIAELLNDVEKLDPGPRRQGCRVARADGVHRVCEIAGCVPRRCDALAWP